MRLAVIPARGGSKRIPMKNIRVFCGKPIIAWSIEAALESGCFDRVIVSTDSPEVADVAQASGAEIPFMRPSRFAHDTTATRPVIAHAVEALADKGAIATDVCCIYATAPFVRPSDLRDGLVRLHQGNARYVFPVTRFELPVQRALRRKSDGRVEMFEPAFFQTRSQDLEEAWHDAGQFYWASAAQWLLDAPIYGDGAVGLELPRHRVQDIDTEEDWNYAQLLFELLENEHIS